MALTLNKVLHGSSDNSELVKRTVKQGCKIRSVESANSLFREKGPSAYIIKIHVRVIEI